MYIRGLAKCTLLWEVDVHKRTGLNILPCGKLMYIRGLANNTTLWEVAVYSFLG